MPRLDGIRRERLTAIESRRVRQRGARGEPRRRAMAHLAPSVLLRGRPADLAGRDLVRPEARHDRVVGADAEAAPARAALVEVDPAGAALGAVALGVLAREADRAA